jgi:adenylate kinase
MSENGPQRRKPNILVTGTPGCGKTSTASMLAERISFLKHLNTGELIKEQKCYEGRDEELDTNVLDEDKLLDHMEGILDKAAEQNGGVVVDFHMPLIFPERWFDLVLVLRTKTELLFDRLNTRGYNEKKRSENMEAEIMQVILEEAREGYSNEIVHEVSSNTVDDMEQNIQRMEAWCKQWIKDNADEES